MPGEHAYFSPSAASRWLKCPASLYLSENIIETESSPYAHEGTVCHTVAADCITKKIAPTDFAGKIIEKVSMTTELIDGIQLYVDEIQGLVKEYEATQGKIEHKIQITDACWGTADALLWNKDTIVVGDLKMGKGVVVQAEDNDQLKLYAVGALMHLADICNLHPEKVVMVIIQPRTPDPVRKVEIPAKELIEWYEKEASPIIHAGEKVTECNPGPVQCRWCPVSKKGCTAEAKKNINDAQRAFTPFTNIVTPIVEGEEDILTLKEMAALKRNFPHIQSWIEQIDTILNQRAFAGEHIPGFKLVEGRSIRVWGADEKKIATLLESLHMEPYTKKLVSPTQAEKAVGKKQATLSGLATLIVKPKGKPTLALESDKRSEINTTKDIEDSFSSTLLVGTKENSKLSALQRMRLAGEEAPLEEKETLLSKVKTASGGSPKSVLSVTGGVNATPPAESTKRFKILQLGKKGGITLQMAADIIGCTENMVKMHLKYLNERDGYNYEIYDDFTFKVTEGE